ncbi:glutathione S-transferase N-terminal domain-containing protein [Rhizobium sp. YK2]|uniref:glutathione S-transferase N-terminal domain-containing protein n=1 Tax=Rhizobium sp. YK2 TaxID=1860096 RepID=UPI00084BF2FD|nr:glutathione S-transferase N-terminal domain-containing protein [Rhizobium sp. YK2]OEC94317.1 glutathione S-transferase [Rhizobium sp. YK2]
MILFYYPGACSIANHIALIEVGMPYKLISINQEKKTQDGRDFLAINPKGYIPALETDEGEVLTENAVILNYIAEKSGRLLPKEDISKWRALEALAFMTSEIHGSYAPFFRNFPEPEKVRAREKLAKAFSILSDQMGSKTFLISDELTIADCYLFWVLMASGRSGVDLPENLKSGYERLRVFPSVNRALSEEGLG